MADTRHRVVCSNERGGKESFALERSGTGIRIDVPTVLTRTDWTRQQAAQLRDTLTTLLDEGARGEYECGAHPPREART